MQSYEDAVIHTLKDSHECQIIIPFDFLLKHLQKPAVRTPFDELVISFLDAWSKELLSLPTIAKESGLLTFAFWCRRAHIESLKKQHVDGQRSALGRGLVFHVASTNMPLNPGYTLAIGLLSGNTNIVKLSTRYFSQTKALIDTLQTTLQQSHYEELYANIGMVRYDMTETELTDTLSKICDVRLIWGGDDTIKTIRTSPINSKAYEITFPERYSLCIIGTDHNVVHEDLQSLAQDLYNDIYLFDQNAFTAPHLIVWLGTDETKRELLKKQLMDSLLNIITQRYPVDAAIASDKLMVLCREAIDIGSCERLRGNNDNRLVRIKLGHLDESVYMYKGLGGLLHEYDAASIEELTPFIDHRVQTLAFWGIDKILLHEWVMTNRLTGVDRIVPIGQSSEFNSIWDGFDLICSLSRIVP